MRAGYEHVLRLLTDAASDDEAIRMAHLVADVAQFDGASEIEVRIIDANERDVGIVADALLREDDYLSPRQHRLGSEYKADADDLAG